MSKNDLKTSLHALIDSIEDSTVLQAYLILLSREAKSQEDFWHNLDDQTKSAINVGLADFDAGRDSDFFDYMKSSHGIER
ncbi:hypothetical protein [Dyadobacter fanqingshengii]|uniref:Uncharacterized protein n=1 Tax=Dyadobacter fanqingshengii TaxID=2906443 RepID=A0A9X1PFI8_9BACT|nr:hypothetical protein [Dyadobacter fanqingshengii]MCF0042327.1 hypothetical protein [Dyadobacter fanqingshengii]USJ35146.1 hypothetical protein NFI81_20895 [Dyadobacter fanqingshengii]